MIQSLLIANRGEIACRIIRTARDMGIRTVAVYSDADAKALHVRQADEAVHIGPSPADESYLVGEKIIAAAKKVGAEAIHPGYGFLSENADFAQAVGDAGLIWVGPRSDSIRAMGLKDAAKKLMEAAGVRVTPGYMGEDQSPARLAQEAEAIGYPVLVKAVAGGGGKGMRKVERAEDFAAGLESAKREAKAAFGNDEVYLEKLVRRARHVEVQVLGRRRASPVERLLLVLGARVAEDLEQRVVRDQDVPVRFAERDAHRSGLEDVAKARLALPQRVLPFAQRLLGAHAVRDVRHRREDAGHLPAGEVPRQHQIPDVLRPVPVVIVHLGQ